jgi:hypothetical protein
MVRSHRNSDDNIDVCILIRGQTKEQVHKTCSQGFKEEKVP